MQLLLKSRKLSLKRKCQLRSKKRTLFKSLKMFQLRCLNKVKRKRKFQFLRKLKKKRLSQLKN